MKRVRPVRQIVREIRDGHEITHVPVGPSQWAVMDAADADRMQAAGVCLETAYLTRIDLGGPHVALRPTCPHRFPFVLLARLVTGAAPGERVKYRDGDRLNLTRANLKTELRAKTAAVLQAQPNCNESEEQP